MHGCRLSCRVVRRARLVRRGASREAHGVGSSVSDRADRSRARVREWCPVSARLRLAHGKGHDRAAPARPTGPGLVIAAMFSEFGARWHRSTRSHGCMTLSMTSSRTPARPWTSSTSSRSLPPSSTAAEQAEDYQIGYNEIRPHEAISWNRPKEVHLGLVGPTVPTFQPTEILPTT